MAGRDVKLAVSSALWALVPLVLLTVLVPLILSWTDEASALTFLVIAPIVVGGIAVLVTAARPRSTRDRTALLHPFVGPLLYMMYALLVPPLYMLTRQAGIASIPFETLTVASAFVMALTVGGYTIGALVALSLYRKRTSPFAEQSQQVSAESWMTRSAKQIAAGGRVILLVALAAKAYQVVTQGTVFNSVYGADQLAYDQGTSIAVIGEALVAVGSLALMYGNALRFGRPLRSFDYVILSLILFIATVLLGSRGEAIAPLILFFWFRLRFGKPVRMLVIAIVLGVVAIGFVVVSQIRTTSASSYGFIEQLLWQTSSPQLLTGVVTAAVPSRVGFYGGETYLNALRYFLPGGLSRELFGDVTGTGALAYREIAGITNVNQGFGFALPTEAYLNFGFGGAAIVGVLLGLLLGFAYRWATDPARQYRLSSFVYPLVISYLPYGIRSDFLGQFKSIVYPLIILGVLALISRELSKSLSRAGDIASPR